MKTSSTRVVAAGVGVLLALATASVWGQTPPGTMRPATRPATSLATRPQAPLVRVADVIGRQFAAWDVDGDGELKSAEVTAVILDPAVKGDVAAAAAAVNNYVYQEERAGRTVKVTREWLTTPTARSEARATTRPATRDTSQALRIPLTPQGFFERARTSIRRADRRLWGDEHDAGGAGPEFVKVRQGSLGNCYFISMLGGRTYWDASKVGEMVSELPTGGYRVRWADGTKTEVPPLTDGEIGVGGASTSDGLWIRVMEKALAFRKLPEDERETTLSAAAIGRGGNTRPMISLLTGHKAEGQRLFAGAKQEPPAEQVELRAKQVRKIVTETLAARRLISASTPDEKTAKPPPGMSPKHAYAVLGYDEATDKVRVWNPHANTFAPKGPEGLAAGYVTKGGVFEIPTAEFVRAFGSIAWETAEPVTEVNLRPATRPTATTRKAG